MEASKSTITQRPLLPMSLVAAICAGVIWINSTLIEINYKLETIEEKLEDKFTKPEMENWILRFKMQNPGMDIPKVVDA